MARYVIDGTALDLSCWRPDGCGGWESMAQGGSAWEPALWDDNDPTDPARTAFAVCFGSVVVSTEGGLHAEVVAEAARIVDAGVASYDAAFAVGRYGNAIDLPRASAASLAAADRHMVTAQPGAVAYAVARGDIPPSRRDLHRARMLSRETVDSVCADWRRLRYSGDHEARLRKCLA